MQQRARTRRPKALSDHSNSWAIKSSMDSFRARWTAARHSAPRSEALRTRSASRADSKLSCGKSWEERCEPDGYHNAVFMSRRFNSTTTAVLTRAGGALYLDENSAITPGSYAAGTLTSYTFSITATSSIPVGGHVIVNFPSEYSLQTITVDLGQNRQFKRNNDCIVFNEYRGRQARHARSTAAAATDPRGVITVVIGGIQNPATAGVYRSFTVFTTKANGGLLDGSYYGFETGDYGGGRPAPSDTIHVGGTNTVNVLVHKQNGTSTVPLSGSELEQVKIGIGCPDKGFFVGEKWLNASSIATYSHILDGNYIVGAMPFNMGSSTFYDSFSLRRKNPLRRSAGRR